MTESRWALALSFATGLVLLLRETVRGLIAAARLAVIVADLDATLREYETRLDHLEKRGPCDHATSDA